MQRMRPLKNLRHMLKAKPTRAVLRQQIKDAKRRISIYLGNYLVLLEEGTQQQIALAKQKAKNEVLKIGPELEKLGQSLGEKYALLVHSFLDSIDSILYESAKWIDEAKTTAYFSAEQKLEKSLKSAKK